MTRKPTIITFSVATLLTLSVAAFAGDSVRVKLDDGTTWRGETARTVEITINDRGITRVLTGRLARVEDRFLVLESEIGAQTIFLSDVIEITDAEMDESVLDTRDRRASRSRAGSASRPAFSGDSFDPDAPGVFVLPLSGIVGMEFRHEEIEALLEEVDQFGPGQIVVLHIDSPGGQIIEMEDIHFAVTALKENHRVVAWVEQALSAACAVASMCDEIYFMSEGTAGAATAIVGNSVAPQPILTAWRELMGDWMEEAGRPRIIADAMVERNRVLSYDKDPVTGEVRWYDNESGQHLLSGNDENYTFNSSVALHSGFAQGVADTPDELARLLDLPRWNEKSQYGRDLYAAWHRTIDRAKKEMPKIGPRLAFMTNTGDPIQDLARSIQIQKEALRWWRIAPNVARSVGWPPEQQIEQTMDNNKHALMLLRRAERDRDDNGRGR